MIAASPCTAANLSRGVVEGGRIRLASVGEDHPATRTGVPPHFEPDLVAQTPDLVDARTTPCTRTAPIADVVLVDRAQLDLAADGAVADGAAVADVHQAALPVADADSADDHRVVLGELEALAHADGALSGEPVADADGGGRDLVGRRVRSARSRRAASPATAGRPNRWAVGTPRTSCKVTRTPHGPSRAPTNISRPDLTLDIRYALQDRPTERPGRSGGSRMRLKRSGAVAATAVACALFAGRVRATTRPRRPRAARHDRAQQPGARGREGSGRRGHRGFAADPDHHRPGRTGRRLGQGEGRGSQRADRAGVAEDRGDREVQRLPRRTSPSRTASPRSARPSTAATPPRRSRPRPPWRRPSPTYLAKYPG